MSLASLCISRVLLLLSLAFNYVSNNLIEYFLHARSYFCWRFMVDHIVLLGNFHSCSICYLFHWVIEVAFIASQSQHKIWSIVVAIIIHFVNPIKDWLETFGICKIEANQCSIGISVIHTEHGSKLLLTACVPNV